MSISKKAQKEVLKGAHLFNVKDCIRISAGKFAIEKKLIGFKQNNFSDKIVSHKGTVFVKYKPNKISEFTSVHYLNSELDLMIVVIY